MNPIENDRGFKQCECRTAQTEEENNNTVNKIETKTDGRNFSCAHPTNHPVKTKARRLGGRDHTHTHTESTSCRWRAGCRGFYLQVGVRPSAQGRLWRSVAPSCPGCPAENRGRSAATAIPCYRLGFILGGGVTSRQETPSDPPPTTHALLEDELLVRDDNVCQLRVYSIFVLQVSFFFCKTRKKSM